VGDTENNFEEENLSEHDRLEDQFSKLLINACKKQDSKTAPFASDNILQF